MTQDATPTERALTAALVSYDGPLDLSLPVHPSTVEARADAIRAVARHIAATLDAERAARAEPGLRERLEAIDIGIYPAASPAGPRTEWQEGWNAAETAFSDAVAAALEALGEPQEGER
jgi:hypothetical protein